MTEFVTLADGRIACDVAGAGPLVVLAHGMGTWRQDFRHLVGPLVAAGYRVVNVDMRGHGESSLDWPSVTGKAAISRTDVAHDLLGVIGHFGGPAVIVGHSLSGGSATIAAAQAPELVTGIVEINPFTLTQSVSVGALFTVPRYRRGGLRLMATQMFKTFTWWRRYLDVAYPTKPADYDKYITGLGEILGRPGRFAEFMKTGRTTPADAEAYLPEVHCPALVIMGTQDPDYVSPEAEGNAIVAAMHDGLGRVVLVDDGGHYPHAQFPDRVAAVLIPFLEQHAARGKNADGPATRGKSTDPYAVRGEGAGVASVG
ncbi:alpha/beta fold hydrolase [Nocardia sp. KC 131]|uniref:alpha/beta fold hydrolase n=1 Tax=Nocardia arseniciresistens TaxID=3392119 RepID=UPI00398EEEE3